MLDNARNPATHRPEFFRCGSETKTHIGRWWGTIDLKFSEKRIHTFFPLKCDPVSELRPSKPAPLRPRLIGLMKV